MKDSQIIQENRSEFQMNRLKAIIHRLRAPNGCPWDAEQTHESLLPNLIEETYEVVDTIRRKDFPHLKEELGDLLLQVVFHAEIASEDEHFILEDVAYEVSEKLIRRHPHVFAEATVENTEGVLTQWEEIKRIEKGEALDLPYLHKTGEGLPPLLAAKKIQKKVSKVGFDWPDSAGVVEKIKEELQEVEEELLKGDSPALEEELGDLLFSVVNLTRKLKKDPDLLLHEANEKFKKRFTKMESLLTQSKLPLNKASSAQMEEAWNNSKEKNNTILPLPKEI